MPTIPKNTDRLPWEWKPTKKTWARNESDMKFYTSSIWRRLAKECKAEEPFCRECLKKGITTVGTITDHILSRNNGGAWYDKKNLQTLCTSCHNKKDNK